jgi:hypothetical protein
MKQIFTKETGEALVMVVGVILLPIVTIIASAG